MRSGLLGVLVAAVVCFCLGPWAWLVLISVGLGENQAGFSLDAFGAVLRTGQFAHALLNSALVAGATTVQCIALSALAAFALAKLEVPGKKLILAGALAISVFPPIATVTPLYLFLRAVGLRDSLAGLVLPYAGFALPLALWILTSFFRDIPNELYQAARVDGCTPWQAFRRVLLPIAAPGLATTAILVFVFSWNEFLYALTFISSPQKRTVPVAISLLAGEHREPWAEIAAASIIATVPLIGAVLWFQRRIVSGLTAGAVKG